jgi:uncharacterized membrane protein
MSYLLYARQTGGAPICAGNGCATVQQSRYAEIFGIPVSAVGLVGFLAIMVASLAPGELARLAQATVALSALGFSAYLLVVQALVIGVICEWCVAGDLASTALAVVVLLRLRFASTGGVT